MSILQSGLGPNSPDFSENATAMEAQYAAVAQKAAQIMKGGSEGSRQRHESRGKLLPRHRIEGLLDPGAPFLEVGLFAASGMYGDEVPSAGAIAGIGRVEGRDCMVLCNDATVKGGTYFPMTVKKHLRAQEIAEENHLPCIYLVDSGGANLNNQTKPKKQTQPNSRVSQKKKKRRTFADAVPRLRFPRR